MNEFDRHIRSKIYHLETDVPTEMWSNIASELTPRRKRRPFIFWFFGAGIAVLGLTQLLPGSKSLSSEYDAMVTTSIATNEPSADPHTDLHAATAETNIQLSIQTMNDKMDAQLGSENIEEAAFPAKTERALSEIRLTPPQEMVPSIYAEKQHVEQRSKDLVAMLIQEKVDITPAQQIDQRSFELVSPLPGLDKEPKIQACPSFGAAGSIKPFAEFNIHAGYPIRSMTLKDPELGAYRDLRRDSERIKTMLAAEAMVGFRFRDRIELKTGLGLRRLHEVFDFTDPNASRTITSIITDTIYNNGTPVIRTDTSIITEYGQRIKLSNNNYTFIDIPLIAGYRFDVKQHRFWFHAGVSMNMKFWQRGDLLSSDQEIVSISSNDPNRHRLFKTSTGIDVLGSLSYELGINTNQSIQLRANFRYPLQDLTLDNYPIDQRYKQVSLGLAWKHNF